MTDNLITVSIRHENCERFQTALANKTGITPEDMHIEHHAQTIPPEPTATAGLTKLGFTRCHITVPENKNPQEFDALLSTIAGKHGGHIINSRSTG